MQGATGEEISAELNADLPPTDIPIFPPLLGLRRSICDGPRAAAVGIG